MRKPWIGGNWKMHKGVSEARNTAKALVGLLASGPRDVDVVLFPSFPLLATVSEAVRGSNVAVGGQTVSEYASGAYTGEVSGGQLTSLGCTTVLIGHSERRHVFLETDAVIRKKLDRALLCGLEVVLCVGEKLEEREAGATEKVVGRMVRAGLEGIDAQVLDRVSIAYEPVWAIGTGKVATPEQAGEVHSFIRHLFGDLFGKERAARLRIHYGGSVKADNVASLLAEEEIDGALVGGASLEAEPFFELVRNAATASN